MQESKNVLRSQLKKISDTTKTLEGASFIQEEILSQINPNSYFARKVNFTFDKFYYAPYGGIIGVEHNNSESNLKIVDFYDSNLNHILALFPPVDHLKGHNDLYITPEDMILCIYDNMLHVYDIRNHLISKDKIFEFSNEETYLFSTFFEHGLFVGTSKGNIYFVDDFSEFSCKLFGTFDASTLPTYAACLPPTYYSYDESIPNVKHGAVVYIPIVKDAQQQLICVQQDQIDVIDFPFTIRSIEFNASYSMLFIITEFELIVYDYKFSQCYLQLDLSDCSYIRACWCGNSTILLTRENSAVMVGISEESIIYETESGCLITPEVDGARLITRENVRYIREIPKYTLEIAKRKRGNLSAKLLFSCSEKLAMATRDTMTELGDGLIEAINGCLDAITYFREPEITHQILKVIIQAKQHLKEFDHNKISKIIINKRICEQIAKSPYKMNLTYEQLLALGHKRLLMRLCNHQFHYLAFKIADYLNVSDEFIFDNWAYAVLLSGAKNENIVKKLKASNDVLDFVKLAKIAYERNLNTSKFSLLAFNHDNSINSNNANSENKVSMKEYVRQMIQKETEVLKNDNLKLATLLLDANPVKARSVPLLIQWGQWPAAISAAAKSNDAALISYTIDRAEEHINESTEIAQMVKKVLVENPIALRVWIIMHPNDNRISQYLIQSNHSKEAVSSEFVRYVDGIDDLQSAQTIIKKHGDSFDSKVMKRMAASNSLCDELHIPKMSSPYEVFDYILINSPSKAKSAARKLDLSNDEITARKIFVGQQQSVDSVPCKLLLETLNSLEDADFEEAINVLLFDYKRRDLVLELQEKIENKISRDILQEIVNNSNEVY
ncbi:vacuolar assembling/sorting protein VPS16 [Histomonas meleagridis]|uniref:vacuolar assembling/sorting protein VPS16 n=1 Tax=Histomonas meleagridis TaxID=135588 RepID=UPI003559D91B|nr:vacuolar assembling/sorting protein VPS16 [Histomonas meleagridis]KAH0797889.1 vacuolar assembling/sorting protein VPS16 [Histomonas meleagridis]